MQNQVPSQVTSHYWVYANNQKDRRRIDLKLTGKFLLFIDKSELDNKWKIVKKSNRRWLF